MGEVTLDLVLPDPGLPDKQDVLSKCNVFQDPFQVGKVLLDLLNLGIGHVWPPLTEGICHRSDPEQRGITPLFPDHP